MSKIFTVAAALAVIPVLAFTTVSAGAIGQVGAGDIYRVRNVTTNGEFANTTTATCNQEVQFRVRIHNSGPDTITNVKVKATLYGQDTTNHGSEVTVSADNLINGDAVTDVAGVTTDKSASISYVTGSTQLLGYAETGPSPVLRGLPDGIVEGGVNIGSVEPLTPATRSVQFKAKFNCDTPEPPKDIQVCELKTKDVITIKENEFNSSLHSRDMSKCKSTPVTPPVSTRTTPTATPGAPAISQPVELVKSGPAQVAAVFAAATVLGAVAYNLVLRRTSTR